MSDLQNLPEILVLYTKDSLVPASTTLKYTWNVPMLSDTRVLSSYVSLVGVGGEKLGGSNNTAADCYTVVIDTMAENVISTNNKGTPIGFVTENQAANYNLQNNSGIPQALIPNRGSTITIQVEKPDGNVEDRPVSGSAFNGIFMLRFDYIGQTNQARGFRETQNQTV
tara:strand:+ start:82 stop:585 length:504 start_codon:yes stop_codon:yes gene_type:complete